MKQLHHIANQYSRLLGEEPKGLLCILGSELVDKRSLYKWVS